MIGLLSGEFFLENRANGGTVVLLRSLWVTLLVYTFGLALNEITDPTSIWGLPTCSSFRAAIHGTIPWAGAIFAGAYAAFYTRFSSQWAYLAGLYNQILQADIEPVADPNAPIVSAPSAAPNAQVVSPPNADPNAQVVSGPNTNPNAQVVSVADARTRGLAVWWAAFIEDALELHLATKPMFASVIHDLLEHRPEVKKAFIASVPGGAERIEELEEKVRRVYEQTREDWRKRAEKRRAKASKAASGP
jgi:hypothetical protein